MVSKKEDVAQSLRQYHPLQRIASPSRGLSALLHGASLVSFAINFRYLFITPNPINDSYGWHLQYLTVIGLSLSTITFSTALLADATLFPRLFALKNALVVASAPLEVLISLLYWPLRAIDPKLVIPELAPPLNTPIDIGLHALPTAVLLIDLLFFSPPWSITALPAVGLSSGIAVAYYFWVEQCFKVNGFYPYPIFDNAGPNGRLALFVGSAVVMALGIVGLRQLYGLVNGWEVDEKEVPGRLKGE